MTPEDRLAKLELGMEQMIKLLALQKKALETFDERLEILRHQLEVQGRALIRQIAPQADPRGPEVN